MTLKEGSKIKQYTIGRVIGEGGLGVVYRARDNLDRDFAIKVLHDKYANNPDHKARFLLEARAAAQLKHDNVVGLHQVDIERSHLFIVSEYVEGKTLRRLMEEGPLQIDRVLAVALDVAAGLAAAHSHGITHRDVKPENIIINEKGRAKLLDFGLAKFAEQQQATILKSAELPQVHTDTNALVGTVEYMSPEQTRGSDVHATSDVWSFGVLCYEMLTRRLPFQGQDGWAIIEAIRENKPASVSHLIPECPREFARLVRTCLKKQPSARYPDATKIEAELAVIISDRGNGDERVTRKLSRQTFLTRFSNAFEINNWKGILEFLLVPSLLGFIYFNIRFAGAVTLIVGLLLLSYLIFKPRHRKSKLLRRYCIAAVLVAAGSFSLFFSPTLDRLLLKNLYGTTINPYGKIRQITRSQTKQNSDVPWPVIVTDSNNRIVLSTGNESKELGQLFASTGGIGRLIFLSGTAGTGKSRLLLKWSYLLSTDKIDYVFFVNLKHVKMNEVKSGEPIVDLLSNHTEYGKVIPSDSQDYYRRVLRSVPSLLVLDGLDEIDARSAELIVMGAHRLARETPTITLIAGRPESIFMSDFYQRNLKYSNESTLFLFISDTDRNVWERFMDFRATDPDYKLDPLARENVKSILNRSIAAQDLAHELDYFDVILKSRDQILNKGERDIDDFALVKFAVMARTNRNGWRGEELNKKLSELTEIAYQMSANNTTESNDAKLDRSGFVDVNRTNFTYQFSPRILQAYFATKAFEERLDKGENPGAMVLSKMLLENILNFPTVVKRRHNALVTSFSTRIEKYIHSLALNDLALIARAINDDQITIRLLVKHYSRDVIENQILRKA